MMRSRSFLCESYTNEQTTCLVFVSQLQVTKPKQTAICKIGILSTNTCTYIHAHIHTYMYIHTYICTVYIYIHVYIYILYICMYVCTYMCVYVHVYMYMYLQIICLFCKQLSALALSPKVDLQRLNMLFVHSYKIHIKSCGFASQENPQRHPPQLLTIQSDHYLSNI